MREAAVAVGLVAVATVAGCMGYPGVPSSTAQSPTAPQPTAPTATPLTTPIPSTATATPTPSGATTPSAATTSAATPTLGPTGSTGDPDDPGSTRYDAVSSGTVERLIHQEINDIRESAGLNALGRDDVVASVSRAHSEDMFDRGYFSHGNPDGERPFDRYRDVDDAPTCTAYGENIASNWVGHPVNTDGGTETYGTSEEIADALVEQWMESAGHRENIHRSRWTHEGIGVYVVSAGTDEGEIFATQNFCQR